MQPLTIKATVSGFERLFRVQLERLSDLTEPLREVGREIRESSRETFQAEQGRAGEQWEPLAGTTRSRLQKENRGVLTHGGKVKAKYIRQVSQYLRAQQKVGKYDSLVGQEFYRLSHGGSAGDALSEDVRGTFKRLRRELLKREQRKRAETHEPQVNLEVYSDKPGGRARVRITSPGYRQGARVAFPRDLRTVGAKFSVPASAITDVGGNYYRVAASALPSTGGALKGHKLLGRMFSMIRLTVKKGVATIGILGDSPLAVHNKGGKVGKGATVPGRPFIELLASDIDSLIEKLQRWIIPD